jgi:hypothetical protein
MPSLTCITVPTSSAMDSSNWTTALVSCDVQSLYAVNGTLSITFDPAILCKIDTSDRPADAAAVPVDQEKQKTVCKRKRPATSASKTSRSKKTHQHE